MNSSGNVYSTREERMGEISFDPGDDCRECGRTIREGSDQCHTCRTRGHRELIDDLSDSILEAAESRAVAVSLAFEVRSEVFERAE